MSIKASKTSNETGSNVNNSAPLQQYRYTCYGLIIDSEIRLPELETVNHSSTPDVVIREDSIAHPLPSDPDSRGCYNVTKRKALIYYKEMGQLLIRDGQEIVVNRAKNGSTGMLNHVIQGMAMGVLLHQRGHLTLHASGVSINGSAVVFIGWKRMGKSTTAAALYSAGHRLLSDDTIVLDVEKPKEVLPGFSQIRLDPEAVTAGLGIDPDEVPRLHPDYERRASRAKENFDLRALPLKAIYCFKWGRDFDIERMPARAAFVELIKNSYAQRFLGKAGATRTHFQRVERVTQSTPIFRLTKPRSLERLPELVSIIESHVRELM